MSVMSFAGDKLEKATKKPIRDWHCHLSDETTDRMQDSIHEWISHIERRFKKDPMDARREADRLRFRYADEHKLSLREYVERKIMLLREANITSENELVTRTWEALDATLMVTVRPENLTLDEFSEGLYAQETPCRFLWTAQQHSKRDDRHRSDRFERRRQK